jgi:hypothetical protein
VRWVKALTTLLNKWADKTINLSALGGPLSSKNYEKEERKMAKDDFNYSTDQMAEIYAKLEVSKMLIKLGTDMAKQAEMDIKFYRMTNRMEDGES